MSIHKLNPARSAAEHSALAVGLNFHHEIHRFPETILKARAIRALENIAAKYPVWCYAAVRTRLLTRTEALALMHRLVEDGARRDELIGQLFPAGVRSASVADGIERPGRLAAAVSAKACRAARPLLPASSCSWRSRSAAP